MASPQVSRLQPDSPWRFLTPLSGEDAEDRRLLELTREEELHLVNHMVASSRVSLLYSASGNGKTSLIQAGVLPFFQRQGYATFRTRPRPPWSQGDPTLAFRECLLRDLQKALVDAQDERLLKTMEQLAGEAPETERDDLKALLRRLQIIVRAEPGAPRLDAGIRAQLPGIDQAPLPELLSRISDLLGRDRQILVVCDQFEELFVHYGRNRAIDQFVDELGKVWVDTSLPIHLLFSMREDWVGSMIAFRRQIPEIFRNYFRLAPIRRSVAAQALSFPLAEEGKAFSPEVTDRILDDLVVCYARARGDESMSSPHLGPEEDPFLELPALQIVAEQMWETRQSQEQQFSLVHYRSLVDGARPDVSPAQQALDVYLERMLAHLPGEKPEPGRNELSLDCLYLLTDRERHRRASTLARISRELRQIRPSELDLPQPTDQEIREALDPLVDARLVRRLDAGVEGEEYELAHDFEVRAVLASWRRLDRERARALGRLSLQRKAKDERLAELEMGQKVMTDFLKGLPALGLAGLLWAAVLVLQGNFEDLKTWPPWLIAGSFGLVAGLSVPTRHRRSLLLGILGLMAAVAIFVGNNQYQQTERRAYKAVLTPLLSGVQQARTSVRLLASSSGVVRELSGELDNELKPIEEGLSATLPQPNAETVDRLFQRLRQILDSYEGELRRRDSPDLPYHDQYSYLRDRIDHLREATTKGEEELRGVRQTLFVPEGKCFLLAGLVALVVLSLGLIYLLVLADLARRDNESSKAEGVFLLLWAELVDMLLLVAGPFLLLGLFLWFEAKYEYLPLFWSAIVCLVLSLGATAAFIGRKRTTLGLYWAGYSLDWNRPMHHRPGGMQLGLRDFCFFLWTALNVATLFLLWLFVSPWLFWFGGRGFADRFAGLRPVRQ